MGELSTSPATWPGLPGMITLNARHLMNAIKLLLPLFLLMHSCTLHAEDAAPTPALTQPLLPTAAAVVEAPSQPAMSDALASAHWLVPLLQQAMDVAKQQPLVVKAAREAERSRLAARVIQARWSPVLTVTPNLDENRYQSTNLFVSGSGLVRDRNSSLNASIGDTLPTGTTVKVQGGSVMTQTTNPSALSDQYYTSNVALVISQALLQGNSYSVNRTDLLNAEAQADLDHDARDEVLESQFAALAEDWINLGQHDIEIRLRKEHLDVTKRNLVVQEERVRQGVGRELDAYAIRRDLVTQQAALATAERAAAAIVDRLHVTWPTLVLPPRADLEIREPPPMPPDLSFAQTRVGIAALRRIDTAARNLAASRNTALDRLDLTAQYGKVGTALSIDESWNKIGEQRQTFHWIAGLTYEHRFGSDADRIELERSILALDQAKLQGEADERAWHADSLNLRLAYRDALERIGELDRVLGAYRDEYRVTKAQVDAGLMAMRDLISTDQALNSAIISILQARLDALRAEMRLRAQEDRLLELAPIDRR